MTAGTPFQWPSLPSTTGTPPPPQAMGMTPASRRASTDFRSRILRGFGLATMRRQPRPASSAKYQPVLAAISAASASVKNLPTGLVGLRKAGSSASTSTSVTMHDTTTSRPWSTSTLAKLCCSM